MTDDELFREALDAHRPDVRVPDGFADRVVERVVAHEAPRSRARAWRGYALAGAVAACAAATLGWQARAQAGEVTVAFGEGASRQVSLGRRARAVVEPGTTLRYRVGGWSPSHLDLAELSTGSVFFRVDGGGAFEVRTPGGTVRVTGTCFRVSAVTSQGDDSMTRMMRARWFGAGALSVALAVTVYEGSVTLAGPAHGRELRLGPGQSATVLRDGTLSRGVSSEAAAHEGATTDAGATSAAAGAAASEGTAAQRAQALEREVARLRQVLAAHDLSPETGEATRPQRRGIDDDGETDLTPDEWRQLAQRGELRFAVPGVGGRDPEARIAHQAQELGLRDHEVAGVREVFRRAEERLTTELRGLYREAAGADPGSLSLDALQSEIRDKTPGDAVGQIDWTLAQERGGLAPRQSPRPDMLPYERMMRALVAYESGLEEELTALVGPRDAHDLLHGASAVGRHSYGRTGRVGDGGTR